MSRDAAGTSSAPHGPRGAGPPLPPALLYSGINMKLVLIAIPFAVLGIALAQGPNRPPGPAPNQPQQPRPQQQIQQQMQPQQPQPPDFSALKAFLNLSDAQIRQMQQAREKAAQEAGEKEKTIRPQIEEKRMALADLLEKDSADATAVGKTMLDIRALERQIRSAHEAVRTAEINVMNAEQKAKFKAIQDAANLPAATREAQRLGLVPGPPQGQGPGQGMGGPRPRMQGMGSMRMQGMGMRGTQPRMQGPMMGPGRGQGPAQFMAPPPGPRRPGDPEGDR